MVAIFVINNNDNKLTMTATIVIINKKQKNIYSFNSYHMWLTCRDHFGNVLYSVLTQENALYT